jgi:hypothetical protein
MSDQTVPMIGPDGSVADVPLSGMPGALRAGAKMAVDMVHAGTGSRGVVPQDRYSDALAAGAVPYHPPAPAPTLPEAGPVSRFLTAAGANLPTPSGMLNMFRAATAGNPTGLGPSGGVVQGFANDAAQSPVATAVQAQGHVGQSIARQGIGLAGFNTDSIGSDYRNGDFPGFAGDVISPAAQLLLGLKAGSRGMPESAPIDPAAVTGEQSRAFTGLVSRGSGMGKNFDPYAATDNALPAIRQAAANHPEVTQVIQKGTPQQFVGGSQFLVDKALQSLEDYHNPIRQSVAGQAPFSPDTPPQYAQALDNLKSTYPDTPGMAPQRAFIDSLKSDIGNVSSLEDLNRYRKQLNDLAAPSYDKTQVAQSEAPNAAEAYRTAADSVRQDYYNRLQELTGVDMRPTMRREGSLLDVKQSLGSQGSQLLQKTAVASEGKPVLRDVVDRLSKEGIVKGSVGMARDRVFGETPLTQPQYLASRFLSKLPGPSGGLTYGSPDAAGAGQPALLPPRPEPGSPVAAPQGSPTYQLPAEAGTGQQSPQPNNYPPLAEQYAAQRTAPSAARPTPVSPSQSAWMSVSPQGSVTRRFLSLMPPEVAGTAAESPAIQSMRAQQLADAMRKVSKRRGSS